MRFTDLPLDRPVATVMVLLCLTVLGTVSILYLPIGFMPAVDEPEIDVEVPFPGSHPLEGLRQIVRPIEEEVATIPEVKRIFGRVEQGSGQVEVQFDWDVDLDLKKMEVREAVERARAVLPADIGHIRVEADQGGPSAEVLGGRISAQRDLSESWDLLDRKIRRPLERIRGVARVNLYGVDPQEVRVDLDLPSLKRHGVSVGDVIRRIDAANLDLDLGVLRDEVLRYDVRTRARFRDVESIRRLDLGVDGLRLRDVAEVNVREPLLLRGRHLNRNFAIGFDVFKEPTANTVDTVDRLVRCIEEMRQDPELQGIDLLIWQNQAEEILQSLKGLRNAGLFGGLLAVFVLYFFLRRLSTTLIVAVAIPFSLLVTCGMMFAFGLEFNVLTMLGLMLGVGMLVDNAVVVIENVFRLQGEGMEARKAAREGPRQVAMAVLAATATTLIVWSWLFLGEPDEMQIYIGQVALVICLSVCCSLLISLSFIPLAAARLAPRQRVGSGFLVRRLLPRYRALLSWTLQHRAVSLLCLITLAGSAAIPIWLIEKQGDVLTQTRDVVIVYQVSDPSSIEVLEGHVNRVEDWLEREQETLGYADIYSWFSEQANSAQTRVYLPQAHADEKGYRRLTAQLRDGLPVIAGVELEIGEQRGRRRGPRRGGFARVALHGEDPEYLEELAAEIEESMRGLEHVREVYGPSVVGSKEARVVIDPERAHALGLSPQQVADAVNFAFRGRRLRRFQGARGEIEVVVGLPERAQPGLAALTDLPIPVGQDETVALGAMAEVEIARTPQRIRREARKTTSRVTIEFDEEATTTQAIRTEVERIMQRFPLPDGYSWDWGTWMRRDDEALGVMLRGILISLTLVLLLMAALFESFTQPLAILITLPLALFGAFWTLWLAGFVFEILGFIGVIILIGVVVNNGIVMVDHVNSLRRAGKPREQALIEGCGDRLRPVLMTVITTVVGLVPLAMSQFTVAQVYIQTLAVAMIGGLVSSSVFTLVALPVWYTTIEDLGALLAGLLPRSVAARDLRSSDSRVMLEGDR